MIYPELTASGETPFNGHQDRHTDGWNESAVRYTGSGLFQTKPHG